MRKRLVSLLLCLLLLALMVPGAWAEGEIVPVTLGQGDTVYGICQSFGLDYNAEKNTIMMLNGWDEEIQMSMLRVGDTILLPGPALAVSYEPEIDYSADAVEYFIVPYVIQNGDNIEAIYMRWGLRYETCAYLIRMLNGVENLNDLAVGKLYLLPTTAENVQTEQYITVVSHIMRPGENAYNVCVGYGLGSDFSLALLNSVNLGADLSHMEAGSKLMIPLF